MATERHGPDFLVIGAQKSGTTSLYRYLTARPDVVPAQRKQVDFFDVSYDRGSEWYLAHFPRRSSAIITGEASPYYMIHPHVPGRVRAFDPEIKLLAILRNPVDRAYSGYQHQVRNGREPLSFEEAIEREEGRLAGEVARLLEDELYVSTVHRRHSYLARSRYAGQLEAWLSLFPRRQLLVLCSEWMFERPQATLDRAASFLSLPPHELKGFGRHMPGSYTDGMTAETRMRLVEYFRKHNEHLYELLGVELPWDR